MNFKSFHIVDFFALGDLLTERSRVPALSGGIRLIARGTNPRESLPLERQLGSELLLAHPLSRRCPSACIRLNETDRDIFAFSSLWGKFGGLYACGATFPYTVPLPKIFVTHLFSKPTLKRKDF